MKRFHDGEVLHGDTAAKHAGPAFRTLGPEKRIVYGGGGITPDIFVGFDTSTLSKTTTTLYINGTLDRFVYTYYIQHISAFQAYKGPAEFAAGYHDEDRLWKALVVYSAHDKIDLSAIPPKEKDVLQHRLKALLARQIWRTEGYYEITNTFDPAVAKALDVVDK
jgi:carboxyl-terminal processing protease